MKSKIITFIVSLFFLNISVFSTPLQSINSGYQITVSADSYKGKMAYLAYYWKDNPYIIDSIQVPPKGTFVFSGTEPLNTGQYLVFIKPDIQVELLIDKEQTDININLKKDIDKSTISGNKDTELLWSYISDYNKLDKDLKNFERKIQNTNLSEKERIKLAKQYKQAYNKVDELTNQQIQEHDGSWFASFVKASRRVSPLYLVPENNDQYRENKKFMRDHYFDNIDFTDGRLWNTNFFVSMLDNYLTELIPQHPDTIAKEECLLVEKTAHDGEAFEKMLSHLYNQASTSHAMGMENVWAKLAEEYIFDKNLNWIDSIQYNNMMASYYLIQHNRIGMQALDLKLESINGDTIHTNDIESDFTLLYFYSTDCGYCHKEIPLLRNDFYPKYKDKGFKVILVNLSRNVEAWKEFVEKNDLDIEGWYNVHDPKYQSEYWLKYDTSATPSLYLMDKNKTIMAKKLNIENLNLYLERILN